MTHPQRNRSTRKVTLAALAVSAAVHAAALAWLSMPIAVSESAERAVTMLPPLADPVMIALTEVATPVVEAASTAATEAAGGAGEPGAPGQAAPVVSGAPAHQAVTTTTRAEPLVVAAVDSLPVFDVLPQGAVAAPVAVAAVEPSAAPAEAVATQPAAPRTHTPGSAAAAKGGGGSSPGSAGAGANPGFGGIGVKVGGGPKRHPPRLFPGRGRW